jgi:hypothetical protein
VAKIVRSDRKGKKWSVKAPSGKTIHAGASGYTIAPGTPKGDNYCARSSGIKTNGKWSPNALARHMWGCRGKKSYKESAGKVGDDY